MEEDYSKYPRFLYQYQKFDINFVNNLINHQLWFSDFYKFNDPFDCQICFDYENSQEEIYNYLVEVNKDYDFSCDNEFIQKRTNVIIAEPDKMKRYQEEVTNKEISNYRVLCLSQTKNNNIMWSHYSGHHSGVCIKLDISKDKPFFSFPLRVEYKNKYPKVNYINNYKNHDAFRIIFRNKFLNWKYEKEIRIIKDKRNNTFTRDGLLEYKKEALIEINFGLRSKNEDIRIVKEINTKFFQDKIKINKAYKTDFSYNLSFKRI